MKLRFSIFGNRYYFTFKFVAITCLLVALFSSLGVWQCHRAEYKRALIKSYAERPNEAPIVFNKLFTSPAVIARPRSVWPWQSRGVIANSPGSPRPNASRPRDDGENVDYRFYPIELKGHFDNKHTVLLDNKTYQGRVGYEVYTPFIPTNETANRTILIDRGWLPANENRAILPEVNAVFEEVKLKGVLNAPPAHFSLGAMTEGKITDFPLRIQYVDLRELTPILGQTLAPYVVWLDLKSPYGFAREWKVSFVGPEKHIMYAVQWFAFATSLLVIFVVLNWHRTENERGSGRSDK